MKQRGNITSRLVGGIMAILSFMIGFASCNDGETTDSTEFMLYYTSMTDISPSMTGTIASPTYKGAAPSGFVITGVTFGEEAEAYNGDSFVIDEATGAVTIGNTSDLKVGKYKISVSCVAGGNIYAFKDAIVVNFMKAVPDGITVEPSELLVEYADARNSSDNTITLPTAQVKTDGDHISITGYEISSIKKDDQIIENFPDPLFEISNDGVISLVKGCSRFEIGTYILNLKLNTAVAGSESELGLYADAVKINIISKPLSLTYTPAEDLLEEESVDNQTEYKGGKPVYEGSLDGVDFSIASVSPAEGMDKFAINPAIGEISVAKGHGFKNGESYTVSVLVKNQFCEEGVLFENVFTLNVVEYIQPIENFGYPETSVKQALKIDVQKNSGFQGGGNLSFAFSEEDQKKYDGILAIDEKTGEISAPKYNELGVGVYDVHVIATNNKGTAEATLKLNIVENENYFSYISYGNNLVKDQTPGTIYDNQYRIAVQGDFNGLSVLPKTDVIDGTKLKWSLKKTDTGALSGNIGATIDETTGMITLVDNSPKSFVANKSYALIVIAKAGTEDETAIEREVPVFFNCSVKDENNVTIQYTPFALRINPQKKYVSSKPEVVGVTDLSKLLLDYRRTFNYYNIYGKRDGENGDGSVHETGVITNNLFLTNLWTNSGAQTGAKAPIAYYNNSKPYTQDQLNNKLAYVDNSATSPMRLSVVVNPNKWYDKGWADGLFIANMTYTLDGNIANVNGGTEVAPVILWFDKDYVEK